MDLQRKVRKMNLYHEKNEYMSNETRTLLWTLTHLRLDSYVTEGRLVQQKLTNLMHFKADYFNTLHWTKVLGKNINTWGCEGIEMLVTASKARLAGLT